MSVSSGHGIPWIAAAAVALGAIIVAVAGYRRALGIRDYGRWTPWLLVALRVGAILLLGLLVVNPILRRQRTRKDSQRIAVLVDDSRSMSIRDTVGGMSRLETAERILERDALIRELSRAATVETFAFDGDLRAVDPRGLAAVGEESDLSGAVSRVAGTKGVAPLCAVIVVTDGCETGVKSAAQETAPVPIYAIGIGSVAEALEEAPDLAVTAVSADRQALLHSKVDAKVGIRASHLEGERVTVQILRGERVLAQQSAVVGKGPLEVPLLFTPEEPGLFEFEARILPHPSEKITENNRRFFALRVMTQKIRVLYYEGTPRWNYKFLTRELKRDSSLTLEAVLRTNADRAYQTGSGGLPAGREGFRRYDCVILGDVRSQDFTQAQATALREFVSEDGSGLVVVAGKESFSQNGLPALGLEPLLPVALTDPREVAGSFSVTLTPEGATHPAFAGLGRFPPIESVFAVGAVRPGAQVLAQAGDHPLAAAQRYGAGRVFLCATDADWKWVMKYKDKGGDETYVRLWGQAIRWAANREADPSAKGAVKLSTDKDMYRPGEAVRIRAQGEGSEGIREASVGGEKVALQKNLDRQEGVFFPKRAGLYEATAGEAACSFFVEHAVGEFDRLALNESLLRRVASASGGQYFDAVTAKTLPEVLQASGRIKVETLELVFADSWIPFALVAMILAIEWLMRKRMQVM